MASFSCYDNSTNRFIEIGLCTWTNYPPSFNIEIRTKAQAGSGYNKPEASAFIPIHIMPTLINNISNPMSNGLIQYNTKNSNSSLGREGNSFVINSSTGASNVTLSDEQWANLHAYLVLIYNNAPLIKEIGNTVRMQVINLLRQCGLDTMVNNRYKTTNWYSEPRTDQGQYNGNSFNANNNQQQQMPAAPIPNNMNMPPMAPIGNAMPPMTTPSPMGMGAAPTMQTTPPVTMPNMGSPMPPTPPTGNTAGMIGGMQNMLNNAFSAPQNPQQ